MARSCIYIFIVASITIALSGLIYFHWMVEVPFDIYKEVGVSCGKSRHHDEQSKPFDSDHQYQRNRELATKYTIRMNTYRRNDLLKRVLKHYVTCSRVHSIQVVWSDQENPPPSLESLRRNMPNQLRGFPNASPLFATRPKIEFEMHSLNSLNNRFRPLLPIATEAVFSVDDDLIIPCSQLDFAHTVWRTAPETMVGFMPRMHGYDEETQRYTYQSWWFTWKRGIYSMVLTKACFLHQHLLYRYSGIEIPVSRRDGNMSSHMRTTPVPKTGVLKAIHDYVDKHRNCEDIAMSFMAANVSLKPSTWVRGAGVKPIGSSGLSSDQAAHYKARSDCINVFADLFNGLPLITASHKVDHASNFLFWQ